MACTVLDFTCGEFERRKRCSLQSGRADEAKPSAVKAWEGKANFAGESSVWFGLNME